jgi:hypothetical protein
MSKSIPLSSFISAVLLISSYLPAFAKPVKFSDGVTFDFKGCFQSSDGNDVTCVGDLLSRRGERTVEIHRATSDGSNIFSYIVNSKGKTYIANEVTIGDDFVCKENPDATDFNSLSCGSKSMVFVEGVSYRASYIFRDVPLPTPKISLFSMANVLKFRNIIVKSER